MSAATRQIKANPATKDLWRIAETDDVDELQDILARGAAINASDVHGMTALMRAAQHGRLEMVRALIAQGADLNATRSDKFTPLMFAAFFGHTEIVKTLVEHGATTNAATRSGASAQMWATARAFEEVARYLEKGCITANANPLPPTGSAPPFGDHHMTLAAPAVTQRTVINSGSLDQKAPASDVAPVVKALKDPPEIWDLVHEVPRHFDARAAFLSRLKSMNTSLVLRTLALMLLISACAFAVLTLRGAKARNDSDGQAQPGSLSDSGATAGRNNMNEKGGETSLAPSGTETDNSVLDDAARSHHVKTENLTLGHNSIPAAPTPVVSSDEGNKRRVSEKLRRMTPTRSRPHPGDAVEPVVDSAKVQTPPTIDANAQPQFRPSAESTEKSRTNAPLNPQLIAPVKGSQPKAKVIQWP